MSRPPAPVIASGWPRPWQVLEYFENSLESLGALRREAISGEIGPESKFYGLTPEEFSFAIERARTELEHQVVLLITASFEAVLRVDLAIRCRQRRRDSHSRALRARFRSRNFHEIRLDEILDVWKAQVGSARKLGNLRQLVLFRHWLAHGRYWKQKSGLTACDPYEAWDRGNQALSIVPVLPEVQYAPPSGRSTI